MEDILLAIAFSFSAGSLILFSVLGIKCLCGRNKIRKADSPDCLGYMSIRHNKYCSEICSMSARCALLGMDDYMRKHPGMLSANDNS